MTRPRNAATFPLICAALLTACAGAKGNSGAKSGSDRDSRGDSAGDSAADEGVGAGEPFDPCASGTCTPCGNAVCLSGFYCEEEHSACGWLPECAGKPSCDCVGKYFEDCSCEERGEGVYLSCS